MVSLDGPDHFYLTDSLGTIGAIADEQGDVVKRYRYEPYGEVSEEVPSNGGPENPLRLAGQYQDSETGLYKMGLRYYDPKVGRWTQKDPLNLYQDPRQGNRYSYAGADPVNMVDPSGAYFCGWGGCPDFSGAAGAFVDQLRESADILQKTINRFVQGCLATSTHPAAIALAAVTAGQSVTLTCAGGGTLTVELNNPAFED